VLARIHKFNKETKEAVMLVKHILVPVDFSESSISGLNAACEIARKFGAKLHLVNAFHVPTPAADLGGAPQVVNTFISEYKEEIFDSLEALKEHVPLLNRVDHDESVYVASTLDAIYTAIEVKSIDLIVMGTRKTHSGFEHLLGGISTDVIQFAKCPVLVIPEQVQSFEPKTITLAVDYKNFKGLEKLNIVADIARIYDAAVTIVHIDPSDQPEPAEQVDEMTELTQIFEGVDYKFEIAHGTKIKDRLINFIDENHIDMVVMMPRKHDLFQRIFEGSVTKKVAIDVHIPLLAVHE